MDNKPEQPAAPSTPSSTETAGPTTTPAKDTATKKPAPEPTPPKPSPKEKQSGPGWLWVILSLLLALLAVLASGYLWQLQSVQQQRVLSGQSGIAGAIQRVDEQADANRALQRQLDRQADEARQQQRRLSAELTGLQGQLAKLQNQLATLSTTDRDDWLLAEAEYLLRLANQRLLMGKEVQGALDLLAAADAIARELDDSALYPVRQALANDMTALRTAARVDIEGLYLQLGALAQQADRLRLFEMPELQLKEPEMPAPQGWQQRLESGLQAAWEKLSHYIQIRRRDEVYQPLLAPEYEAAVRQNLRLMFEQAQMAALSGKQRLYEDSLAKASQWLSNYYRLDQAASAAIIQRVEELSRQPVAVPLPDISSSLRALKTYLDTARPPAEKKPAEAIEEAGQ